MHAYRDAPDRMGATWFEEMEGNRRQFINRHAGSADHWRRFFGEFGFAVRDVEACIHFRRFFLQDTFQRGLFPYFRACAQAVKTPEERGVFIETFTKPVARAILEETDGLRGREPSAYFLLTLVKE
jgi:hypothetical protein